MTIYLDYAATTPVDPRVAQHMATHLSIGGVYGNPASQHVYGQAASDAVETARSQVAALFQADPSEFIWTSGATESINLALKGAARLYQSKGKHIVTMKTEHKATIDACMQLEKEGFQVTYLMPNASGLVSIDEFKDVLREDTILVSIMQVNNETGIIQDVEALAAITAARGILFHVDAAQAPGKLDINLSQTPIDLLSLCAHKVYGPKGIGALYLRKKPRVRVEPFIHGGGHEQGMRSGTLATHQIVGMGAAFALAQAETAQDKQHILQLRERFLRGLYDVPTAKLNVVAQHAVPHILNLRFEGMLAKEILHRLPGIAASTASACQGKGTEGSYVLRAMGYSQEEIRSSIRFSFGRFTTDVEVDATVEQLSGLFERMTA